MNLKKIIKKTEIFITLLMLGGRLYRKQIRQIVTQGPKTDGEYFLLFPRACKTCGSRTIITKLEGIAGRTMYYPFDHQEPFAAGPMVYRFVETDKICGRTHKIRHYSYFFIDHTCTSACSHPQSGEKKEMRTKIHSRFLTEEEELSIPETLPQNPRE